MVSTVSYSPVARFVIAGCVITGCVIATLGFGKAARAQTYQQWAEARRALVETDLAPAGITRPGVLAAMRNTPRHEFVGRAEKQLAYFDMALPIGHGQTISPPFAVASMTEWLDPHPEDRVLEIGTGSGYQAAVLSGLVRDVYTIEIVEELGAAAAKTLDRLGYKNVHAKIGDGFLGWPDKAPFDKIIVTCSPENVPAALAEQLREGGRLVIPLGDRFQQSMYLMRKENGVLVKDREESTYVVPMTGQAEEQRLTKPGKLTPLVNGDFEQPADELKRPRGWYYVRQAEQSSSENGKSGRNIVVFANDQPGRPSQILQAIGVDGREVKELGVTAMYRAPELGPGATEEQAANVLVTFFNQDRAPIGQASVGPLSKTGKWQNTSTKIRVPRQARTAMIAAGLLGATGRLEIDNLRVRGE